ncbi:MAG: phosphopentomutase [Pseudomonadota bacterium]
MARAFLVVLDSVGIGGAPDAGAFFNGDVPDTGADTLGHIRAAQRLNLPTLAGLGLWHAHALANDLPLPHAPAAGGWGAATEVSPGKDTPSGHWELAGLPVPWAWHFFEEEVPFDAELVAEVARAAGTDGILGNCHAPGTAIVDRLGVEHLRTGKPICYTSADSVFQIAAHEEAFGLDRLLDLCAALAPRLHAMRVGRVIARPFVGRDGAFTRTQNRKDFAIPPPGPVISTRAQAAGRPVHAIGKIWDIFSGAGFDDVRKGDDATLMQHLADRVAEAAEGSLTFANFVEFDSLYGHRRDVSGYAAQLEWFDAAIAGVIAALRPDDMLILTADHGNDPTWTGTDHTRERVPVLVAGQGPRALGHMGFTGVADLIADHMGLPGAP